MSDFVRIIRIKNANGEEKMLKIPAKLDLERPKRPRTVFTDQQLEILENSFNGTGYLCGKSRIKLAERLGLSDNQVKVWFQNRRTKQKRHETNVKEISNSTTKTTPGEFSADRNGASGNPYFMYQLWMANNALKNGNTVN